MRAMFVVCLASAVMLLSACGSPTKDVAQAEGEVASGLGGSLSYFGSNTQELESFLSTGAMALPDKMLLTSLNSTSEIGDGRFSNGVQRVAAYLEQSSAPPERFAQLCERLRFAFIASRDSDYHFARVHDNLCIRGQGASAAGNAQAAVLEQQARRE